MKYLPIILILMLVYPDFAYAADPEEPIKLMFKVGIYGAGLGLILVAIKSPLVKLMGIIVMIIGVTLVLTQLAIAVSTLFKVL